MNPPMNWVPVILVCPVLACSGFVVWFCALFGFVLCVFAVCLVYDDDGPMDYVQVLPQFSFAALNSRWPGTLICITAHAMSYSVVNDLAKAMKALDGKKKTLLGPKEAPAGGWQPYSRLPTAELLLIVILQLGPSRSMSRSVRRLASRS